MQIIKIAFVTSMLLAVGYSLWLATDILQWFVAQAAEFALLSLRVCGGVLVAVVASLLAWLLLRQQYERNRQRDGAFALREYWLQPWPRRVLNWLLGRPSARVIYDPNGNMGHAAIIHDVIYVVEPAAGWDRQLAYAQDVERTRRVQAAITGDGVRGLPWASVGDRPGIANAATGRMLAGAYDKQIRPATIDQAPALPQLPPPAPVEMPLDYALERTESQAWPLGYGASGQVARFNFMQHVHAAVVGGTGTGKTTSVGYLLACHALRQGWHVVVLDADDGAAWQPFAAQAEVHPTSHETFGAQITALHTEFERRMERLAATGMADVSLLPAAPRRILCIIEEYGDLSHTLRLLDRAGAARVDALLDTLLRRGRKAGVHLALLDQYPEHWSQQIIANTKFRCVFQLGPNQGAKMEEYAAARLPARGAFLLNGERYTAWHAAPVVRQLLANVPALGESERLIGNGAEPGEPVPNPVPANVFAGVTPEVDPPIALAGNGGNGADTDPANKWREFIRVYYDSPAGRGLRVSPPTGVRALARVMSAHDTGSEAYEDRYVGIASREAASLRAEHAAARTEAAPLRGVMHDRIDLDSEDGRAALAVILPDALLANSSKIGTDITGGV